MRPEAFVAFDLVGLRIEIMGDHAQPFGTGKIKTTAGDTEAIFGLSAEELGVQHGISRLSKRSGAHVRRWVRDMLEVMQMPGIGSGGNRLPDGRP